MYTTSMETIYLSLSAQVVLGTFFMKSSVHNYETVGRAVQPMNESGGWGGHRAID